MRLVENATQILTAQYGWAVQEELKRKENGKITYSDVDSLLYYLVGYTGRDRKWFLKKV